MFYTWQADGRLTPDLKLELIGPGLPGQPMYYVDAGKAANAEAGREFVELATSPEVQADGIVKKVQLVPRHRRAVRPGQARPADLEQAVRGHDAAGPERKGKPFPISSYFNDILRRMSARSH